MFEWSSDDSDESSEQNGKCRVTAHYPGKGKMELRERENGSVRAFLRGVPVEVEQ